MSNGPEHPDGFPALDVHAIFDLVLTSAARLFQGEGGSIMLVVEDDELEVVASPSNPAAMGARVRLGQGVSGAVAASGDPRLISGRVNKRTKAVDSGMCLPLLHGGRPFGVLNINAKPVHIFNNHDLSAGTAFGAHAADALAEARLYELARQQGEGEPQRHLVGMQKHFTAAGSVDFVGRIGTERVDLIAIARGIASSEDAAGRPTGVRANGDAAVRGEGKPVRRLLQELIDNGHRHGEPPVRIFLQPSTDDGVVFTVTDSGPGVPADDRMRVFDPFVRLDRATDGPGLGLGLTIARRLVEGMGGTIAFNDAPAGGASVKVRLPRF